MKQKNFEMPDHIFRAYDIRGIAEKEITVKNTYELARAFATMLYMHRISDCVVGHDCRESSKELFEAFIKGLIDSGITVFDIGLTLSQIVYFAQYFYRTPACAMITASHNPKEFNGFKLGLKFSETMLSYEIERLKNIYRKKNFCLSKFKGKRIIDNKIIYYYIDDIKKRVGKIKKFKIVVDCLNATAGIYMPKIYEKFGCEVIKRHCNPDGSFPLGTPDPTEKNLLEMLAEEVLTEKADIGFAFDADGDRIGIVDDKGQIVFNDSIIAILAKDILDFIPRAKIVYNTLCSKQVPDVIKENKGIPIMWITGHSYIAEKIKSERAVFGGEVSGHIFFLDNFYGHEDTSIASLRLLSYLTRTNMPLSKAVFLLPHYISSPEIKLGCDDSIKFKIVEKDLAPKIKSFFKKAEFTEIDGIRADTNTSMCIIRASQNGPYITIRFEAKENSEYNLIKNFLYKLLKSIKKIDFSKGVNLESFD